MGNSTKNLENLETLESLEEARSVDVGGARGGGNLVANSSALL